MFRYMIDRVRYRLRRLAASRLFVLGLVFTCLSFVVIGRLFYLQIIKGETYLTDSVLRAKKTTVSPGTRGNIYDRNGNLLAYNELAYSVVYEDDGHLTGTADENNRRLNDVLLGVISTVEKYGSHVVTGFGIVQSATGEYMFAQTDETLRQRFLADIFGYATIDQLSEEQKNLSAAELIRRLCTDPQIGFGIDPDAADPSVVLKLINMRYAIRLNSFQQYNATVLASDVSEQAAAAIMENKDTLGGIDIREESLRRYVDSKYFASIIGYTGKISQEEYDRIDGEERKNYSLSDIVGKAGIEQAMDRTLQGKKGEQTFYVDRLGKVLETISQTDPGVGNDVYLTIDKNLQEETYRLIEEKLAGIILSKLHNILDYTPGNEKDTTEIIIPVGDAYNALVGNDVVDSTHFGAEDAKQAEKEIYSLFSADKEADLKEVETYMRGDDAVPYKDLSPKMKAYMDYISGSLLKERLSILPADRIDANDETVKQWTTQETINIHTYLNYAISKNWIDTTRLSSYLGNQAYADASGTYDALVRAVMDAISQSLRFDKMIYKYHIKSGEIPGALLCAALYEQNVLPMDEDAYAGLASRTRDPFYWLQDQIRRLAITPGQLALEPCTGSAVVSDPSTGQVLACVSYPGYDNNRLSNDMDVKYYNQLVTGLSRPFYNNATQERTAPGSTFKMVSALAGMQEGVIDENTVHYCDGEFKTVTPSPRCWSYPNGHGGLSVADAIAVSCNVFFYEVGYDLSFGAGETEYNAPTGIDRLSKYASMVGLDEKTGLEIPESSPQVSDEYPILSAIGQGTNNYTVSQLNRYVATVANKGTLRNLTLIDKTTDHDGKLIKQYESEQTNKSQDVPEHTWDVLKEGMVRMVNNSSLFSGLDAQVAGKTGTAQQSSLHPDHALFVGFAPADSPKYAVSVRIANGYKSSFAAEIGRDIFKFEFSGQSSASGEAARLNDAIAGD